MELRMEEPKVIRDGKESKIVVHQNILPGPIQCARPHYHDYIEILYCLSGTHEVEINWKKYLFSPGDVVLINSREMHQIRAISEGISNYIVVRFDPELLHLGSHNTLEMKYMLPFVSHETKLQKVFKKEMIETSVLPRLFQEILEDSKSSSYYAEFALHTNISRIFLWMLRTWEEAGETLHGNIEETGLILHFHHALEYIKEHYAEDISAQAVAEYCHMSYSYFSRMFKKVLHLSFREYLNFVRIEKAEKLLVLTDLSITDIAMQTGFSSSSYFIQQFRDYKNISPLQFRKKYDLNQD